jgi:hypothetical protein
MPRWSGINWNLPDGNLSTGDAQLAVLMDIRDELKELNNKLACFRVRRMLNTVQRIDKRLAKRLPLKQRGV